MTDRASAQIIRMTPGADIDLGDLLVPSPLTEVRLNGRVLLADGTPAHRAGPRIDSPRGTRPTPCAWVNLIDPALPAYFVGETVWSREDGSFSIPAFRGQRYVVTVRLERGTRWPEVRSPPVVAGTSGHIVIRMEQ